MCTMMPKTLPGARILPRRTGRMGWTCKEMRAKRMGCVACGTHVLRPTRGAGGGSAGWRGSAELDASGGLAEGSAELDASGGLAGLGGA